jgi:hypothetical protein
LFASLKVKKIVCGSKVFVSWDRYLCLMLRDNLLNISNVNFAKKERKKLAFVGICEVMINKHSVQHYFNHFFSF